MARIYSGVSKEESPYVHYKVEYSIVSRVLRSVKVSFKVSARLDNSASWVGTGPDQYIKVYIYADGEWHSATLKSTSATWSGTSWHSKTITVTIPVSVSQTQVSGIKFKAAGHGALSARACDGFAISASTQYRQCKSATIAVTGKGNNSASVKVSGLTAADGYTRTIKWYAGSTLKGTTTVNGTSGTYTFTGLKPATTYTLKAVICSGSTVVRTISVSCVTLNENLEITPTAYDTMIHLALSGMQSGPSYTRKIKVYAKNAAGTYALNQEVSSQNAAVDIYISNLIPLTSYDIRVDVTNGSTVYVTKSLTVETIANMSNLPRPFIRSVRQETVDGDIVIDFGVDKLLDGAVFQLYVDNAVYSEHSSVGELRVSQINDLSMYSIKIVSTHPDIEETVGSNVITFYTVTAFNWTDASKTSAADWNMLRAKILYKLRNFISDEEMRALGNDTIIGAAAGKPIKADIYNGLLYGLKLLGAQTNMANKRPGDAIKLSDIEALRTAFNSL